MQVLDTSFDTMIQMCVTKIHWYSSPTVNSYAPFLFRKIKFKFLDSNINLTTWNSIRTVVSEGQ